MSGFPQDLINVTIHECILAILPLDCFVAKYRIIRVVAGVTSGSNLRVGALRATAPYRKSDLAMTGNAKRYSVVPQALTWVM